MGAGLNARRAGFTLVEVVVAMLLISIVALGIGAVTAKLVTSASRDTQSIVALDLVNERLAVVRSDPAYASLAARYEGEEATIPGFPGMRRISTFERVSTELDDGAVVEYTVVEVTVSAPGLAEPVVRTTTVAAL